MTILITAVGKLEHLGDNVMKSCVMEPIRLNFPRAHITVCVNFPEVFKHNPFIDKIEDGSKIKTISQAAKILNRGKFDILIELSGFRDQVFKQAAESINKNAPKIFLATHQVFRDYLRKIFDVPPPPFTDGDIPIVFSKVDEFMQSLRINKFKIKQRYFPKIFTSFSELQLVADKIIKRGFDAKKATFIFCESASEPSREWGVKNFVKLAELLTRDGAQIIITNKGKNRSQTLAPYLESNIDKKLLFFLPVSLKEFFALMGLNKHFSHNVIAGIVSGDSGGLHAAQAVNNVLSDLLRPVVICLGHDQITGDIRYADPGTVYVSRLKSRWDKRLDFEASKKLRRPWRRELSRNLGMPYQLFDLDRMESTGYLTQFIPNDPKILPVFWGRQIYTHTLLRNILRPDFRPLTSADCSRIYRRLNVKRISPKAVYKSLKETTYDQLNFIKGNMDLSGIIKATDDPIIAKRIETTYLAQELLRGADLTPKTFLFHRWPYQPTVLLSSKLAGDSALGRWPSLNCSQKKQFLKDVLERLKIVHRVKFSKFGKFGLTSSWLFDSWKEYIQTSIEKRIKEAKRARLLSKREGELLRDILKNDRSLAGVSGARLVHHDVKLDNLLINCQKFSGLIDFEYSVFAPVDYEADTLLRSFEDPEVYFGPKAKFLKKDIALVYDTIKSYYPKLLNNSRMNERLRIYNIKFYLDLLVMDKKRKHCQKYLKILLKS